MFQGPIKDAMRILSSSDLYQPSINKWKDQHDDQIVTDFLDGLVQVVVDSPVFYLAKCEAGNFLRYTWTYSTNIEKKQIIN